MRAWATRRVARAGGPGILSRSLEPEKTTVHTVGANYYTPEINTSEIMVDFQWHFPMDFQWHFPTKFHLSVVFPKGLSLSQWIFAGVVQWILSGIYQWNFTVVISGV